MPTMLWLPQAAFLSFTTLCSAQSTSTPSLADLAALGTAFEVANHASPDLSWYDVPTNFSDILEPGTVLKTEYATDLTNYTVPGSLSMSRIIYTTQDAHGSVLPASAYILWPYHALPINDTLGYDIALFTHGTSGLFQPCAPSNYRSLQYNFMIPYLLAQQGTVVVAPDYAGHGVGSFANGTKILHPWATSPAQANDAAFAITAARSAFSQYLKPNGPFVAIGHSEGGRAAWGFAERQAQSPVPGYRGTVALAPVGDGIKLQEEAAQFTNTSWSSNGQTLGLLTIPAITRVYPSYNYAGFTNTSASIYNTAYEPSQGCLSTQNLLYGSLPPNTYAKPGWTNAPEVRVWQNLTNVGNKRFAGPLLVLAGNRDGSDGIIPFDGPYESSLINTAHSLCDQMEAEGWEESFELVGYKAIDHFGLIQASENRWLSWIKTRLNSASPAAPSGCAIGSVEAFEGGRNTQPITILPNFFVSWINVTSIWQLAL